MTNWHLQQDESGDIFIHFPGEAGAFQMFNLGPRDEVLVRFADFFGDEGVELPEGFIAPDVMKE